MRERENGDNQGASEKPIPQSRESGLPRCGEIKKKKKLKKPPGQARKDPQLPPRDDRNLRQPRTSH